MCALIPALAAMSATPARRPHYGGTLRVAIGAVLMTLDAAQGAAGGGEETSARAEIEALIGVQNGEHREADAAASPFRVSEWQPGKLLTLAANEKFSGGRPYVDGIEISMGRNARDRLLDLELNKTDFAELAPQDARRATERGVRVSISQPDELLALVFLKAAREKTRTPLREAISSSIDRSAIVSFILQKTGEPAAGLLPQWVNGTAFLFSMPASDAAGVARAKELLQQMAGPAKLVLGYDSADALEQAIAERVAVNAKEAGIAITTVGIAAGKSASEAGADATIARSSLDSRKPREALTGLLAEFATSADVDASALPDAATAQDVFDRERAVVGDYQVVPLAWTPHVYGLSSRVRDWSAPGPGEHWPFADVWLEQTATSAAQ